MRKPTKSDYLAYAGYSRSYQVEICACKYDENGNILDFATDSWGRGELRNVPVDQPLQLNILDRNGEKMEDIGISISETGEIECSSKHFEG
jgi:hypothetical protein